MVKRPSKNISVKSKRFIYGNLAIYIMADLQNLNWIGNGSCPLHFSYCQLSIFPVHLVAYIIVLEIYIELAKINMQNYKQKEYKWLLHSVLHLSASVISLSIRDENSEFANSVDLDEMAPDLHCLPSNLSILNMR